MIVKDLGKYVFVAAHEVKGNTYCPGYQVAVGDEINVTEISKANRLGTEELGWIANDIPVQKVKE